MRSSSNSTSDSLQVSAESLPVLAPAERTAILAAIEDELGRRRNSIFAHFGQWRENPVGFVSDALLGFIWSKQREIIESVRVNRRTAVKSCHDVGKSAVAARIVAWWLSCFQPGESFAVTLAPTFHQVRGILWREINRVHAAGGLPGELNTTEWWHGQELVGFGRSPRDTDGTAIQGIHAPRVLVIGDEACGLSKELLDAADSLIANDDSRILLIGNPDDPTTEFANVCKPGSGWNVIRISAFDSPNFTGEEVPEWLRPLLVSRTWVKEKAKSWGETSPLYQSKVLGEFPQQATDALIPITAITAAIARYEQAVDGDPIELGVDVARFGDDSSVIYRRAGFRAKRMATAKQRDTMYVTGMVLEAIRQTVAELGRRPRAVKIDDNGIGGAVTDRMRELKAYEGSDENQKAAALLLKDIEIVPVNVGEAPATDLADTRYKNLRAEINWGIRLLFTEDGGRIAIDPDTTQDLQAQCTQIKYKLTSAGEIQIESKADMKKRTKGVSPDDWDAIVLAFASPSFSGSGLLEHYRRQAETLQLEQRKRQDNQPVIGGPSTGKVRMRCPDGVSTVYGGLGSMYVAHDGHVHVTDDDAKLLVGLGFERV